MTTIRRQIAVDNHGFSVEVPDACPICHRHSEIEFIRGNSIDQNAGIQAIFRCAYLGCRQFFFCYYGPRGQAELKAVKPVKPNSTVFTDAIREISPSFVEIYSQAEEAAQNGLAQISGPGYRKAFEFLIKDYAKKLRSDKAEEIEKKFSGAVVDEYIVDARIQAVAKRCLWLGNDETHYLKKWTQHDISDLVTLIQLTAHWIEIEHLSASYVQSMPG